VVTEAIVEPDNTGLNGRLSCTAYDQLTEYQSIGGGQGPEVRRLSGQPVWVYQKLLLAMWRAHFQSSISSSLS
jgi:hypothetical protein